METVAEKPESTKPAPPYFAFRTLVNTLEDMKKRGIPTRVDRTYLTGMSGAGQTQFLSGLRSLGLIDASGTVRPQLKELVNATGAERQRVLGEVLRERYPEAIELGKTNATTGQLVEVFREYGAQGDTARKAIAFYLQAARFVGDIPISPMFQTPKVASSGKRRRQQNGQNTPPESDGGSGGGGATSSGASGTTLPKLHPALAGVLSELPPRGQGWTVERRDEFMRTFEAVANFTIPIVTNDEPDFAGEEPGDEE